MGRLKRKGQYRSLQRIWNVDTVSAREVAEVAQKIRDAAPHTRVYIMTEDELKKAAHETHDMVIDKTAHDFREITGLWMLSAFCLYFSRYEKLGARAIANRLEKITEIAGDVDGRYTYVQEVIDLVREETGVDLQ